jgi:hypothetical protein
MTVARFGISDQLTPSRHIDVFGSTPDGRLFVGERSTDHLPAFTMFQQVKGA